MWRILVLFLGVFLPSSFILGADVSVSLERSSVSVQSEAFQFFGDPFSEKANVVFDGKVFERQTKLFLFGGMQMDIWKPEFRKIDLLLGREVVFDLDWKVTFQTGASLFSEPVHLAHFSVFVSQPSLWDSLFSLVVLEARTLVPFGQPFLSHGGVYLGGSFNSLDLPFERYSVPVWDVSIFPSGALRFGAGPDQYSSFVVFFQAGVDFEYQKFPGLFLSCQYLNFLTNVSEPDPRKNMIVFGLSFRFERLKTTLQNHILRELNFVR